MGKTYTAPTMSVANGDTRPKNPNERRKTKPAVPIAPAPLSVSQLNCLALVGIDPRRWLELLLAHAEVPRSAVGKLRVVAVDDLRMLLAALACTKDAADVIDPVEDDDQPTSAGDVLSRLGLRKVG